MAGEAAIRESHEIALLSVDVVAGGAGHQPRTEASGPVQQGHLAGRKAGRMPLQARGGARPLKVLLSVWVPGVVPPPHTGPVRDGELVQQTPSLPIQV